MKFSELVTEYVVKTDKDKVKHNTRDDFGVYPKIYVGGGFVGESPTWQTVWGLPSQHVVATVQRLMSGNEIGSLEFARAEQGIRARARSRDHISVYDLGPVEDFPAELEFMLK